MHSSVYWLMLATAGALLLAPACTVRRPERIVLIVVDTLRRDYVSAYGGHVPTPNIDRLAATGRVFSNASASFHQTTMSMGALFTGRTPSLEAVGAKGPPAWTGRTWCGMRRLAGEGESACLPVALPTLGERMRGAGYWTIGVVSNLLLHDPAGFSRGFDDWREVGGNLDPETTARGHGPHGARSAAIVNQAVGAALDARPAGAFFLYVHYMDVHDFRSVGSYARAVSLVDAGIGELFERLERDRLLEDAVVVLVSDHGERLQEVHAVPGRGAHYGNPSFEPVLAIPLVVAPAVVEDPGELVRSEDVFRMLLAIAGGQSGPPSALRQDELLLTERRWWTYREGRWKSLHPRSGGEAVLFDLETDPGERRDLAAERGALVREHRKRIATLVRELAAPRHEADAATREDLRRLRAIGYVE